MKVPTSISPNPLFTSTIEIRFLSNLTQQELFQKMTNVFLKELPNLELGKIPKELKEKQEQFKFAADYTLKNDDYAMSFSTNSI